MPEAGSAVFSAIADFSRLRRESKETAKDLRKLRVEGVQAGEGVEEGFERAEKSSTSFSKSVEDAASKVKKSTRSIDTDMAKVERTTTRLGRSAETLKQRLDRIPRGVDVQIDADVTRAQQKIAAIERDMAGLDGKSVTFDADTAIASRKIQRLKREIDSVENRVEVKVDTDTGGGGRGGGIKSLKGDMDSASSSGKGLRGTLMQLAAGFGITAAAIQLLRLPALINGISGAIGVVGALTAAVVALAGALGPVVGLLPALASGVGAVAQGAGVIIGSFSGIGDAIKGFIRDEKTAVKAATDGASAAAAAAKKRRDAARAVEDAARNVAEAEEAAAEAVEDAQEALAEAHKDAARAVEDAADRVIDAERDLVDAQRQSVQAQEDLSEARRDAQRVLEDLRREVERGALSEAKAVLAVEEARARLDESMGQVASAGKDWAEIQRDQRRATLDLRDAENDLEDVRRQRAEQSAELAEAEARGVEGSAQVVDAQEGVRASAEGVLLAQEALSEAQLGVARAQEEGAARIAAAEERLAEAHEDGSRRVEDAQRQLARAIESQNEAITESMNEGAAATSKFGEAMEGQSPIARRLIETLLGFRPALQELRGVAQESFFPGLIAALLVLRPLLSTLHPFVAATGQVLGALALQLANFAASPFFQGAFQSILAANVGLLQTLGQAFVPLISAVMRLLVAAQPLTQWLAELIVKFAQWADAATAAGTASGELAGFFERTRSTVELLGSILGNLLGIFYDVGRAGAEVGRWILESFDKALGKVREFTSSTEGQSQMKAFFESIKPLLAALGGLAGDVFKGLIGLIVQLAPLLTPVIQAIRDNLLPALLQMFGSMDPAFLVALVNLGAAFVRFLTVFAGATPALTIFIEWLTRLMDRAVELKEELGPLGDIIVNVLSVLSAGGLITGIISLVGAIGGLVFKLSGLKALFGVLASPIGLVVLALAALVGGFIYAYNNSETFRAKVKQVVDWFMAEAMPVIREFADWVIGAFGDLVNWVQVNWPKISEAVGHVLDFIMELWKRFGGPIIEMVQSIFGFVKDIIQGAMSFIQGLIQFVMAVINGDWGAAWDAIVIMLRAVWDIIFAVIRFVWDQIVNFIQYGLSIFRAIWDTAWNLVSTGLRTIWEEIQKWVDLGINAVLTVIETVLGTIRSVWDTVWGGIRDGLGAIWEGIKWAVQTGINGLIDILNFLLGGVNLILRFIGVGEIPPIGHVNLMGGGGSGDGGVGADGVPNLLRKAKGGEIEGEVPGRGQGDRVPTLLEPGEFVVRKRRVQQVGVDNMERFNAGSTLHLRKGGLVGGPTEDAQRRVDEFTSGGFNVSDIVGIGAEIAKAGARVAYAPIRAVAHAALDNLPMGDSGIGKMIKGLGIKILDSIDAFLARKDEERKARMGGGTGTGHGFQALIDYLNMRGVPHTVTSTNEYRGTGTRHDQGMAADFVGDMSRIFDTFMEIAPAMYELIYSPKGFSLKAGQRVAAYAVPDHYDHVHAATFHPGEGPGVPRPGESGGVGAAFGGGRTVGASEFGGSGDPGTGSVGYKQDNLWGTMAYAELSTNPGAPLSQLDYSALGGLPYRHKLRIGYNGRSVVAEKLDIGGGGDDVKGHPRAIDLWVETADALGFSGTDLVDIVNAAKGGLIPKMHRGGLATRGGMAKVETGEVMLRREAVNQLGVGNALRLNAAGRMSDIERGMIGTMPSIATAPRTFDAEDRRSELVVEPGVVKLYLDSQEIAEGVVPFLPKKQEEHRRGRPR